MHRLGSELGRLRVIPVLLVPRDHPRGEAVEMYIRREDAERIIEEVRGGDPDLARSLRIEERSWRRAE
jgi:hypothetical protein